MGSDRVRFRNVVFDAERGRLTVAGRQVALDRSSAAILRVLVSEAGKEVHKDRLLEAGWSGRVVHENSLAKAISRLRQAFGAQADALETVHGYGYRLAAEPAPDLSRPASSPRRLAAPILVASASALLIVAAAWVAGHAGATGSSDDAPLIKGEAADSIGRVLWVDDHPQNNMAERRYLESQKVAVYQVTTTEEALNLLAMYKYGAVISDMNRNDKPLDGITLVKAMRARKDSTPFILYTVVPSASQRKLLAEAGGQAATVTPDQLYKAVVPLIRAEASRRRIAHN
jgi:DNA-binding response OmpR family regulator